MALWDVGSFTTVSTATTHSLGVPPVFALSIVGQQLSRDTTRDGNAPLAVGVARSTADNAYVAYQSIFTNSSALPESTVNNGFTRFMAANGGFADLPLGGLTSNTISVGSSSFPTAPGFVVAGGTDLLATSVRVTSVTTVTGSTVASTGYGFSPNAAFVLGDASGSSLFNFSFGFACVDSAGSRSQWAISQAGRNAANAAVSKSATTVSALKLHTTATTAASTAHYEMAVTSFKADGLELTANAVDTARAANVTILGLSAPRVAAGKATITTGGAGVGLTGFTVSNVNGAGVGGQNIGLVVLASIGSSLQTVQAHNMFSIGFASSAAKQNSVAGMVTDGGGASTRFASFASSTAAVTFVSGSSNVHPTITTPPAVITRGVFALSTASSGFTVTFDNTAANGWDVYWAALSNVVSDIGGSVQMVSSVHSGLKEVDHIGGSAQSSFNANSGLVEVGHIGGAAQMAFTAAMGLTPDFFPGEGKLHADSLVRIYADKDHKGGFGVGNEEATERFLYKIANSSSPDLERSYDITTAPTRLGVAEFGNANALVVLPPSSNTHPMRMGAGRTSPGLPLSSRGMSVLALADRAGSDVYLFTTASGSTIHGVRVLLR